MITIIVEKSTGRIKTVGFLPTTIGTETEEVVHIDGDLLPDIENAFYRNGKIEYDEAAAEALIPYDVKRRKEYPPVPEQLDMLYWDTVNGTTKWKDKIAEIKTKYPKPEVK